MHGGVNAGSTANDSHDVPVFDAQDDNDTQQAVIVVADCGFASHLSCFAFMWMVASSWWSLHREDAV